MNNTVSQAVLNDDERYRIASRAPINVYTPALEDTQYVSDYTGNYWPYRSIHYDTAVNRKRAVNRTNNRCESLQINTKTTPATPPPELYQVADDIGADAVVPRSDARPVDQVDRLLTAYSEFDFRGTTRLWLPIAEPHCATAKMVLPTLTPDPATLNEMPRPGQVLDHPSAVAVVNSNLKTIATLRETLIKLQQVSSCDTEFHLLDVYPTTELALLIRRHENLIASVTLSKQAVQALDQVLPDDIGAPDYLSSRGRRDLRNDVDPHTLIAGEFSLLCSRYVDDDEFAKIAHESVIPSAPSERTPRTHYQLSENLGSRTPSRVKTPNNDRSEASARTLSEFS